MARIRIGSTTGTDDDKFAGVGQTSYLMDVLRLTS